MSRRAYQPPLFEPPRPPLDDRIRKAATMFGGNVAFVEQHLAACEEAAKGKAGREFNRCVRGELWKRWRERWRDDRVQLERARDRRATAAAAKPKGPRPFSGNSKAAPVGDLIGGLLRGVRIGE